MKKYDIDTTNEEIKELISKNSFKRNQTIDKLTFLIKNISYNSELTSYNI